MRQLLLAVTSLALFVAACQGGDKDTPGASRDTDANDDLPSVAQNDESRPDDTLVSGEAVLRRAAQSTSDVSSFEGDFEMTFDMDGMSMSIDGEMAFQAPSTMYMTMGMFGEEFEMLMVLPDVYMNMPGQGWVRLDASAVPGFNVDQFTEWMENRGALDLEQLADHLEDMERVGEDRIDGETYAHYSGEFDMEALAQDAPAGVFDAEVMEQVIDAVDSVEFEIWIDESTGLPRRMQYGFAMDLPQGGGDMRFRMDFDAYNGDVYIPDVPEDAAPFGAPES